IGTFRGHAIPGSFLLILGLWWSTKSILKYVCKKQKQTCYLGSKALFHRVDLLEGTIVVGMALIGEWTISVSCFLLWGFLHTKKRYNMKLNWNQVTLFVFVRREAFACSCLCHLNSCPPASLCLLFLIFHRRFFESFIFYNHTHGREMLDIFVHQLLVLVVLLAGLVAFMEFLLPGNVLLELLRESLILLQGTWFWQIGFVLYPLSGGPGWDQTDHDNIMFLTICFCWHYALSFIILGVNYAFITWLVKSRLKRLCPSEVGLLKNVERELESEEEM
uniref:Transmembrane protein 45A n=1 Tax=Otolemur garnettii TaxID=30611 RepID=H0WQI3_OTOGA